jgi:hypothetical protein
LNWKTILKIATKQIITERVTDVHIWEIRPRAEGGDRRQAMGGVERRERYGVGAIALLQVKNFV